MTTIPMLNFITLEDVRKLTEDEIQNIEILTELLKLKLISVDDIKTLTKEKGKIPFAIGIQLKHLLDLIKSKKITYTDALYKFDNNKLIILANTADLINDGLIELNVAINCAPFQHINLALLNTLHKLNKASNSKITVTSEDVKLSLEEPELIPHTQQPKIKPSN